MASDMKITIGGTVETQDDMDELAAAILSDLPTIDWEQGPRENEELLAYVAERISDGQPLVFAENERSGERFLAIENACERIGLSFVLDVDGDDEDPGSQIVFAPGMEGPEELVGSSFTGGPFVETDVVIRLLESGDVKGALETLKATKVGQTIDDVPLKAAPGVEVRMAVAPSP